VVIGAGSGRPAVDLQILERWLAHEEPPLGDGPPTKPQPDGALVKALARAWRWQKLLDRGVYSSVTEIAEAERISKCYVSRILRLAVLAPDIVDAILGGWADQRVILERLERPLPMGWREQREHVSLAPSTTRLRSDTVCETVAGVYAKRISGIGPGAAG
jgi:hypothetical protein